MTPRTLEVVYDGQVFRPETPPDLEPHKRYTISIEGESPGGSTSETAWEVLQRLTGTVDAPEDWAEEHDHYIHGTPKRGRPEEPR